MRLPFRRKDKKSKDSNDYLGSADVARHQGPLFVFPPTHHSSQLVADLPSRVLQRIFAFVCPHACDESYETCEDSASDAACMLCDLRDLAHCTRVSKSWRRNAVPVMYHSVRIDPVHYCSLEAVLAEKRKKTSRFDCNGIPEDPAQARLRLFRRTVRDDPTRLGKLVEFFKIPYMLRESSHVELAQTIAVLPNLHYVDLPEGMFADESSFGTLRLEIQARCPSIRKTTYRKGSEQSVAALASGRVWTQLEVLELDGIHIDPTTLRHALASLQRLRALKVSNSHSFSDEVLVAEDGLPSLPPLEELVLKETPRLTISGLGDFLSWLETQEALKVLTLQNTGVHPSHLGEILGMATRLKTIVVQATVAEAFPHQNSVQPMASRSLETLRYEIQSASSAGPYSSFESGYYSFLANSILGGNFPRLRQLYVLDDTMPDQLQGLPPPNATFGASRVRSSSYTASGGRPNIPSMRLNADGGPSLSPPSGRARPMSNVNPANRFSSNNPFMSHLPPTHQLEVFTKSNEFGSWNFARVDSVQKLEPPTSPGFARDSSRRPISTYGLGGDIGGMGWEAGEARKSVMVGNGTGAFLAVPGQEEPAPLPPFGAPPGARGSMDSFRPKSSGGDSMRGSRDLWR
ncbi:uncharacterized protein F5Z01DRAFT_628568 [Emericellopsis atlantica]|uniref:F-box domain-containing protein n=1 Tax=Emericellopsis atlantica TaxID=2614577 RepID=A0A9P7ZFN6_9HYPO|nr:uncharacterized protein F5Z01DRAFT_628568 [Emericellopsis atlantica]KAG9250851.1 hypothetical protein F5Z01DRAFT_628568 [Emericellopsis atlantica]